MRKITFVIALILIILLSWHAFLITWLSALLLNSTNDFLPKTALILASWKEVLIFVLGLIVLCQSWQLKKIPIKLYKFDYYFLIFLGIALISGLMFTQDIKVILWGLKYDFSFLILFYLIRSCNFSNKQKNIILNFFLWSASSVILWGILTYHFLPTNFLQHFGYSSHISSFNANKPLPMFHAVEGETPRLASTFSGPNQFGFYLMIVIAFISNRLILLWQQRNKHHNLEENKVRNKIIVGLIILNLLAFYALFLTFSRSAWLGVIFIIFLQILWAIPLKYQLKLIMTILFMVGMFLLSLYIFTPNFFATTILRTNSSTGHYIRTTGALKQVVKHPFGTGLGTAGPAATKFAKFKNTYIPQFEVDKIIKQGIPFNIQDHIWFNDEYYRLTSKGNFIRLNQDMFDKNIIFRRFKPTNDQELKAIPSFQTLSMPLQTQIFTLWQKYYQERIAENWHVQMFQEFGYLGGIIYLIFIGKLCQFLYQKKSANYFAYSSFLALSGFIIAGFFLHSFEDSASSLSLFLLIGLAAE